MNRDEAHEVRQAFAEAARGAVPPPLPLAEIEREGRARRRRRRTTALLTGCLLLLAPLALLTFRTASPGPTAPSPSVPAGTARVVASGERVRPLPGVELWLAKNGEHWSTARGSGQFLPVSRPAAHDPAVTLRPEEVNGRFLLSGTYQGDRPAARVEVTAPSGTTHGRLLTLAGDPGWSVWYAVARLPLDKRVFAGLRVTVYDARGAELARSGVDSWPT
ncbi:hypothetical protein [Streptomyces sp. NPDC051636]|uniref:hypothetical protein n=1 Tax=Streptomyces sp. NPDC051636 TaxID=3365663 RepID=UPI00379332BF